MLYARKYVHFNNEALACFLNNVTSEDLADVTYNGSRLKWCNDLTSLKTFVAEVLCQSANGVLRVVTQRNLLAQMLN